MSSATVTSAKNLLVSSTNEKVAGGAKLALWILVFKRDYVQAKQLQLQSNCWVDHCVQQSTGAWCSNSNSSFYTVTVVNDRTNITSHDIKRTQWYVSFCLRSSISLDNTACQRAWDVSGNQEVKAELYYPH